MRTVLVQHPHPRRGGQRRRWSPLTLAAALGGCVVGLVGCLGSIDGAGAGHVASPPAGPDAGVPAPSGSVGGAGSGGGGGTVADLGAPDAATPPPRPTLSGLVLWLDAAQGITMSGGGKVSAWADTSSAHNDARQPNAQYQPTLASGANHLPAVRFSGKPDPTNAGGDGGPYLQILDAASLRWGTGDWSLFVVGSYHNPLDGTHNGALGAFFGRYDVPEIFFCGNWTLTETTEQSAIHIGLGEGNAGLESTRKQLNDGVVRLYVGRKAGDTLELRINGTSDSHVSGPDVQNANVSTNAKNIGIGSFDGDSPIRALDGDIEALVAVRGALDDAQLKALESYLMKTYNVAP